MREILNNNKNIKRKKIFWEALQKAVGFGLFFGGVILGLVILCTVTGLDMLPRKYVYGTAIAVGVIFIIVLVLLLKKRTRWIAILLEVVLTVILGLMLFLLLTSKDVLQDISSASVTTDTIVLYSKMESSAEISDYKDKTIGILKTLDRDNTEKGIIEIEKILNSKINIGEYNNVTELLNGLKNDKVYAVLLNSAFLVFAEDNADGNIVAAEMQEIWSTEIKRELELESVILALQEVRTTEPDEILVDESHDSVGQSGDAEAEKEEFIKSDKEETEKDTQGNKLDSIQYDESTESESAPITEVLSENSKENTITASEIEEKNKPFVLYLSGNDSEGQLNANGRSDVNILMVVNPNMGKILLVNTPRDYYVELAGKHEMDKLTHAGVFGVDESMQTLSLLYNIPIDYYIRLNYWGFMDIIDALGGITVYSDVDFTVAEWHYVVGRNDLSGIEALAFARERYSFESGDRQRGKNQQAVIRGLISKICSPAILTNYVNLRSAVKGTVETNMSVDEIAELVCLQIDKRIDWNIESMSVDGSDSTEYCYSLQENSYVMIPDEKSVKNAKEEINKYLE